MEGEYYLQGQREMASGFLFKPGGVFQFFFSYGALDRHGEGKWELQEGRILLNSKPKPSSDFTLVKSIAKPGDLVRVKMEAGNPALLRNVFCSLENGKQDSWKQMTQDGIVDFPKQKITTISMLLEFCPERFSTVPVKEQDHTEFMFRFEPSIMEVFFDNFTLQVEPGGLFGNHPLLEGGEFRYMKQ